MLKIFFCGHIIDRDKGRSDLKRLCRKVLKFDQPMVAIIMAIKLLKLKQGWRQEVK
jgi:hypothetical protein